jgi:antirestriction protein ArdC
MQMPVPASSRSGNQTEKKDPRLELADRLIAQIEAGTANWQRPWNPGDVSAPVSVVTGKPYRGVNYQNLLTFSPDPSDPRWCTYKQAQEQGWQVRKGEHGIPIEKWSEYAHKRTDEEIERLRAQGAQDIESTEKRLGVRYYTVFHASQIDGIPPLERSPRPEIEGKPDERLSKLAENMGMDVIHAGGRAFYRPSEDRVFMPPIESFERASGYDTTLLHELSHATGHESRLKREIRNPFGSPKYAVEELRAEMSAAMTAASLGIGFDPASQDMEEGREAGNSAAYLASWLKALPEKERKQAIMGAIKDAQGISDYLIERTPELQVEVEQERVGPTVTRGDYVRYRNEIGQELEGVVLDDAQPGEATRLRHITRWPNGTPLMETADHIMPVVLPEVLDVHLVSAVRDGVALNGVDSRTNEYKLTMGSDMERRKMENRVLMDVERARGIYPTFTQEGPQVGDLVRFEPREPGVTSMSFSGRVIAALDTNTGDVRYHLRAETGPENGAEARMYGRDGQFRGIALEQAVGFDRALAAEAEKAPRIQVGDFVVTRSNQFGADWNTPSIVTRIDDSEVRLQDLYRSGQEWEVSPAGRKMAREDFDAALRHQVSGVVPPEIVSEKVKSASGRESAASRDRFVGAVRAFDAEHSLLYGKAPEPLTKVPDDVRPFLGVRQASVTDKLLRSSEEKSFFSDKMQELREIIRQMPETYETDGKPDGERPVSLRYFGPNGAQWFIVEKGRGDPENEGPGLPDQTQALGLADLGLGHPELGYINIPEITRAGAELDYHFTPTTLLEIKREHYPDLLPPEQRPEDLRKEQALQEYQAFYAQLPEREEKLVTEVRERSGRLAPADFRGFSDMMRDFSKGVDDTFGIIREGENRGASAPELRLAQALSTEDISDLPAVKIAHDQSRRLGERFHDLDKEVRASFKARLKEHGKALLESGTLHEPREIVQATYWKHGIEVNPDSPMIGKFTDAIREKNLQTMMGLIGHNSQNPASEEAFSRVTGIKMAKTQVGRVAQLQEWAGPEKVWAMAESQAVVRQEREAQILKEGMTKAWDDLKGLQVKVGDQVVNGQEYVSLKVAKGQDRFASGKSGAVNAYHLVNDQGEYSRVKDVRFAAFAKRVLAADPDGKVCNALEKSGIAHGMMRDVLPQKSAIDLQKDQKKPDTAPELPGKNAYEQKTEARKERYRARAEKLRGLAKSRLDQARRMADVIPFGQPILVGHHSEKSDRRFRERIHQNFGKGFDLLKQADYYERRAKGVNDYAISADDPDAVKKLNERVETLKTAQERMKAANAAIRKHEKNGPEAQQAALEGLGFKPEQAKSLLTPDVMGTVGFASYSLSNNNANIKRLEARIQTLEKARKLEDRETQYAWGSVRENKEINRIQFQFDSKPDEAVRNLMKSSGFRWAPSESAWQRQWTGNAVYAARDVIKKLDERMPPEQMVAAPEPTPTPDIAPAENVEREPNLRDPSAALEAGIKDRDGTWHNLSAHEKDQVLVGTLQRLNAETGNYEKTPVEFCPGGVGGLQARAHFPDGSRLRVSLSRSDPSEHPSSRVDVRIYAEKQGMDGKVTLTQIHEHPGRLRANEALQKISDHREGKVIKQALGVDPKMLNPQPSREAQKAPNKAREQRQGVEI